MAQRGITPQFMMQSYRMYLHRKLRSQRQLQAEPEMAASQNSNNIKSASSLVTLEKRHILQLSNCRVHGTLIEMNVPDHIPQSY